ncbi:MAG: DUF1294 domain-containing protein [Blautia sp.]|nr:DUF1294 domain-containing protein [Blautia sp.]
MPRIFNPVFFLPLYFSVLNIFTFLLFGSDKKRARAGKWRISEATLLLFVFLGGSIGGLIGMKHFHHKTKKWKFLVAVPAALILHAVLLLFFLKMKTGI